MGYDRYRVSIETLENGYEVEVPDIEAINKRKADAKKKSTDGCCPPAYFGDCTKKYVAKTLAQALGFVKEALGQIPEQEYDEAFAEAAAKK